MSTGDIIREGSAPGAVFFLSHGAVDILLESVGEAVTTLEAPQVVGEMAYLTGANAGATVRVKRPVSGVSIRTGQFHQLSKGRAKSRGTTHVFSGPHFGAPFGGSQSACEIEAGV